MVFLKKIFDFYIRSSTHVGIEVCCFLAITYLRFDVDADFNFLAFIFFGTVTGYNFIKYALSAGFQHRSLSANLRLVQLFSLVCFLTLIYFTLKLSVETLLWIGFFGLFTVFYTVPIFPNKKNLRSLHGVKVFVIAFVVTGLTLIVPLIHHGISLEPEIGWIFAQRVAFIVAVMIPFEIRDLKRDILSLGTIPQQVGTKNAKMIGIFLLVLFVVLEFIQTESTLESRISVIATAIISSGFIVFSSKDQSRYYASFWVDAIPIFWFLIFWSLVRIGF